MTTKNDIKIMPRAIVCEECNLKGEITIASGCVIHPSANIIAESGPIILGENCIVEEYATIIHKIPESDPAFNAEKPPVLLIGPNNIFEVGSTCAAAKIGDKNVFEYKSYVSRDVTIANGCIIGAGCRLSGKQHLADNTVIYGKQRAERETIEKQGSQTLQLEALRKIFPNYHHLRKATFDPKKLRTQM